ncbi:hypothetical protein MAR_001647 [Mya arenaria]|uniref:Secreted protein n=1 Tax=Mya arenaria TaxID=6604 RepID=A0ABY7FF77_MYAAR|nr:uncharacterized protein LOC128208987 [Mya arenaria]WAR19809.1 hypothetical protein MAR_001647 [Mya arenaria]
MSLKVVCVLLVLLVSYADGQIYVNPRSRLAWRAASTCAKAIVHPAKPHGRIFAAKRDLTGSLFTVTVSFSINVPPPWRFCLGMVRFDGPTVGPCAPRICF